MLLTGRKTPLLHASDAASLGLFDLAKGAFDNHAISKAGASFFPEVTKTAIIRERKRDRKASAHIRELKALVKKAEEAIEANEQRIAELEAVLADPATYDDPAKAQKIGEEYRAEQDRTDELYEALEAAELAVEEAENE